MELLELSDLEAEMYKRIMETPAWRDLTRGDPFYAKDHYPGIGSVASALALSVGASPVLGVQSDLKIGDDASGFVKVLSESGLHVVPFSNLDDSLRAATVTFLPWRKLSELAASPRRNRWSDQKGFYMSLSLQFEEEEFTLFAGSGSELPADLLEVLRFAQDRFSEHG